MAELFDGDTGLIVKREEWGAKEPIESDIPIEKVEIPILHLSFTHTQTESCNDFESCVKIVRQIQNHHMDLVGLPDITFNFLIGGDGKVYEGRGWYLEPHRPLLYQHLSTKGIEIGYIGDYEDERPSEEMLKTAFNFILFGMKNKIINTTFESMHLA